MNKTIWIEHVSAFGGIKYDNGHGVIFKNRGQAIQYLWGEVRRCVNELQEVTGSSEIVIKITDKYIVVRPRRFWRVFKSGFFLFTFNFDAV